MKKTQFIDLIKTIKATFVSFISITLFVAMSVAIYIGISGSSISFMAGMHNAIENSELHDVDIFFPYGFSDDDIKKLSEVEGVSDIEGTYLGYVSFKLDDHNYQARLISINDKMDQYLDCEGVLPQKENEIGIDYSFAEIYKLNIGDIITFTSDNTGASRQLVKLMDFDPNDEDFSSLLIEDNNPMDYLKTDTFVITSFMRSPEYVCTNVVTYGVSIVNKEMIDCFIYVNKSAFDETAHLGYSEILIKSDELANYSTFSKEYKRKSDALVKKISDEALNDIVNNKNDMIFAKANEVKEVGQTKLDDALKTIEDGKNQITKAENLIKETKVKLLEGEKELEEYENEYSRALSEFNSNKRVYDNFYKTYLEIKEKIVNEDNFLLDNAEKAIEVCNQASEYARENGREDIYALIQEVLTLINDEKFDEVRSWFIDNFSIFDEIFEVVKRGIDSAKSELNKARNELDEAWIQHENAKNEVANKEKQLVQAKVELKKAQTEYDEGLVIFNEYVEKTKEIQRYDANSVTRNYNPAYMVGNTFCGILDNLRYSMASLFVIVGLFVCYSAISRIIYNHSINIGTKKALGLSTKEITISYLLYTVISVFVGCIIGSISGYYIVENILIDAVSANMIFPKMLVFSIKDALFISIVELVLLLFITYRACRNILKQQAKDLLAGPQLLHGKERFYEKSKLWQKISLYAKTIVNNFFNDKRRVFGSIIGIAGSTALIVTAITLNDNVLKSFNIQFNDYYHFDSIVTFDANVDLAEDEINNLLKEYEIENTKLYYSRVFTTTPSEHYVASCLFVFDDEKEFSKMVTLDPKVQYGDLYKGYWISSSYHDYFKTNQNDAVTLITFDGKKGTITPNGYFKFYLTDYVNILDKDTYVNSFETEYATNAFLINTKGKDVISLQKRLSLIEGYSAYSDYYYISSGSFLAFEMVSSTMVLVYTVLSIAMSFLVLLNLLIMFIDEKKNELIILMINGFTVKETKRYIYSDTILSTIIGIILGCIVGSVVGNISVSSFESEATSFLHAIDIKACLIGSACSILFTIAVSLIALRRIEKFKLSDIDH